MMYPVEATAMKALHEHRREQLARSARPRRKRQRRPLRQRLDALLVSIGSRISDSGRDRGVRAGGRSTDPAAAG